MKKIKLLIVIALVLSAYACGGGNLDLVRNSAGKCVVYCSSGE